MRLKSYYAGTVESAICLARQEMGEDAMLVSSRKAQPEARHLGAYEVVFAAARNPAQEAAAARTAAETQKPDDSPAAASSSLSGEMAEIRRQLARISAWISRSSVRGGQRRPARPNSAVDEL